MHIYTRTTHVQCTSTTKDVGYIFQCLKGACAREPGGKVQYFRFVVDPESFAHTVENMFHFSFLIKVECCAF